MCDQKGQPTGTVGIDAQEGGGREKTRKRTGGRRREARGGVEALQQGTVSRA